MTGQIDESLIDETFDAYLDWRDQCVAVRRAYERWAGASPSGARATSFCAYRAALAREELAASLYGAFVRCLESRVRRPATTPARSVPVP